MSESIPVQNHDSEPPVPTLGKRHVVVVLGFFGFFMLYALRVNLSVAIVSMTKFKADTTNKNLSTVCVSEQLSEGKSSHDNTDGEFDWGPETQSIILGSFFWGYIITQIPGGRLAEKFGPKQVLGYSVGLTSLLTIVSPLAARIHYRLFIIVRVLEGLFEGVAFPAMHLMIANWIPKTERGFLATIIYSGTQIGTVITMGASGYLSASQLFGGWPLVFYTFGALGLIWVVFWIFLISDRPENHPSISRGELEYIALNHGLNRNAQAPVTPWRAIIKSPAVWALVIAHFGQNWGFYTLLFQLPTYFSTILGFDIKKNGKLSALPYLLQATCGWIASFCFDEAIKRKYLKVHFVRKLSNTISFVGPALCLYGVTMVECDATTSVILFSAAMCINGLYLSGFFVTHVDMAPDFAGTLMGITNCIANFAGILAPYVVGILTEKDNSITSWSYVFYICVGMYFFAACVFVTLGSAQRQKWSTIAL